MTARYRNAIQFVFWSALLVWSWLLVKPNPFGDLAEKLASWYDLLPFLAAKTLHMSGYAFLTVTGLAGVTGRWRWAMAALVIVHGPLSELAQYYGNIWYDTKRGGCVRDVIVDWVGVAIGLGVWAMVRRWVDPARRTT